MGEGVFSLEGNGHDDIGLRLGGQEEDEGHPGEGRPPEGEPEARAERDSPCGSDALWRTVFWGSVRHKHRQTQTAPTAG
jgi:hypothetical protein